MSEVYVKTQILKCEPDSIPKFSPLICNVNSGTYISIKFIQTKTKKIQQSQLPIYKKKFR